MSKKNIVIVALVILVVIGVGFFLNKKSKDNNAYSVVYMTTGEVYVGKLTTFPDMRLSNGYILQVVKDETDETKSNFTLNPIKDALWAPETMHLIKDNVVFYGPLLTTSKIAQTLAGEAK